MRPGWRPNSVRTAVTALVALAAGAATVRPSAAQPPAVAWELLGELTTNRFTALAFRHGPAPDGSVDTLYVGSTLHLYRYPPGGPLSEALHQGGGGNETVIATATGALVAGDAPGRVDRSTDGARTWTEVHPFGSLALFQTTAPSLGGAIVAGITPGVWASMADGAAGTWEQRGGPGGEIASLQDVAVGPHSGRLLAGWWGGASYSDDGGLTWHLSNLSLPGAMIVRSLALHAQEGHPAGGVAFAGVRRDGQVHVYRSDDAGSTWFLARWFEPGAFGVADPNWVTVAVGPDGVLWAGLWDSLGGTQAGLGTIVRSFDGGQTWTEAADGYGGWAVRAMAFGRDGRLYVAAERSLWRTTTPVVANEPAPPDQGPGLAAGLALGVAPNPAAGRATVTLSLPAPAADVRVAVHDVLGREVAVLHTGPLPAGRHAFDLQAVLPAGVYAVRAAGAGTATSARFTVVR